MIPIVSPEDFSAVGDGIADDTAALQAAVNGAGNRRLLLSGTYRISSTIVLPSDLDMQGTATGKVTTSVPNIALFLATGRTGIRVAGVHFEQTVVGADPYVAGIALDNCTDCHISGNEFEGMQWAGVYLSNSSRNRISGNYFHDFLGTVSDGSDIVLFNASSLNHVVGNRCEGGCDHGILIQDPYANLLPTRNFVSGNRIGRHEGYGIVVYTPYAGNSYNSLVGNDVEDILGTHLSGDSGAGIYIAGAGAGGTLISNNSIRNCCQQTANRSLTPAAIGINGLSAQSARVNVCGNNIDDMHQGDGILVASSAGGVTVTGNAIRIPASNNGSGPGGASLTGSAIRLDHSSNVSVAANAIDSRSPAAGIFLFASSGDVVGLSVSSNKVSAEGVAIRADRSANWTLSECVVAGNICRGTGSNDGMQFQGMSGGSISANSVSSTGIPLYIANCSDVRASGNRLKTSGTVGFQFAGTSTGSFYDLSNSCTASIVNAGIGSRTEFFSAGVPTSGTAAVGDRAVELTPTASNPDYWRCIGAGSPGLWKAGAALAA